MWKHLFKKRRAVPEFLLRKGVLFILFIYQYFFSPTQGIFRFLPFYPRPSCVFYPTCSEYAVTCFKTYSFLTALKKTIHRLSRCHGGTDPQVDLP